MPGSSSRGAPAPQNINPKTFARQPTVCLVRAASYNFFVPVLAPCRVLPCRAVSCRVWRAQVLAMTMAEPGSRMSLKFKLEGTKGDLGRWGHEYLRSLAGEIGQEYSARRMRIVKGEDGDGEGEGAKAMVDADAGEADVSDLIELVDDIVPFHLQHNAEAEAVDLLVEVQVS